MKNKWNLTNLGVMLDMAGCPNSCRHCWLGRQKNASMSIGELKEIAAEFKGWRDEEGRGIRNLGFFSWWREPDYRDDYRELWALEQELSSPGCAKRFELHSTWRLARDESYAKWAAALEPKVCQISFFGMEETTDWGMRRKGAFRDQLLATERCIEAGITPRWQLFLTKRCLGELEDFLKMIYELKLHERCKKNDRKFEIFLGGIAPEGNGYELEEVRLEKQDLKLIPKKLISISREGTELLGNKTEAELFRLLLKKTRPKKMSAPMNSIAINANFDAYPNVAEPAEWWKLGNIKTDGVDKIIKTYRDETSPGMIASKTIPLNKLALKYANPASQKLYDEGDLITRMMHQWGEDHMKEEEK